MMVDSMKIKFKEAEIDSSEEEANNQKCPFLVSITGGFYGKDMGSSSKDEDHSRRRKMGSSL
ncbi:hypothetical protein TSUD_217510 [Trifolium subterraneum]|uniref:Uncharacterized protein n=1 Tax=Trifolium subterraneum TaxID=3900 RepID=A0A2Z6MSS5_TRISU|nr:hypothetical protein TSUD_217510 [Trifolium subterraneum]